MSYKIDNPPTQKVSKPNVEHIFTDEEGFVRYQLSNFKCVFPFLNSPVQGKPFLYQIYWYINGDVVYVTEPVKKEDATQLYLNEKNGLTKMGIRVCIFVVVEMIE